MGARLSVGVVGGGPAGLVTALVLAQNQPKADVVVYDRRPPLAAPGFGVGLHQRVLDELANTAPHLREAIGDGYGEVQTWTLRRGDDSIDILFPDQGIGIRRGHLLEVLTNLAQKYGVTLRFERAIVRPDDLPAHDVIIGADGVGSVVRHWVSSAIGVSERTSPLLFLWSGASVALDGMMLDVQDTEWGPVVAHVMPYAAGRATFQVDAHRAVVDPLGLAGDSGATDLTAAALGETEVAAGGESERLLRQLFAHHLDGQVLHIDRDRWSPFQTVRCESWQAGNVVLVGDAAHTAHYTVGSGTRLAIEDGLSLGRALAGCESVSDAFAYYEQERRSEVERLQWRGELSELWWASVAERRRLSDAAFGLSYATRTGANSLNDIAVRNSALLSRAARDLGANGEWSASTHAVYQIPLVHDGRPMLANRLCGAMPTLGNVCELVTNGSEGSEPRVRALLERPPDVLPWTDEAWVWLGRVATALHRGRLDAVVLTGGDDSRAVTGRLALAEQLRLEFGVPVGIDATPQWTDRLAIEVLSRRCDFVTCTTVGGSIVEEAA